MSEWQPIETAPKDGSYVILCVDTENFQIVANGHWLNLCEVKSKGWPDNLVGWWCYTSVGSQGLFNEPYEPTRWMRLPE